MNSYTHVTARLIVLFWLLILFPGSAGAQDVTISIHLRGVFDSKISLLPLSGANALKPIVVVDDVKEGETITLQVSPDNLPGEFVLQFDYREAARLYLVKEAFTWEIKRGIIILFFTIRSKNNKQTNAECRSINFLIRCSNVLHS